MSPPERESRPGGETETANHEKIVTTPSNPDRSRSGRQSACTSPLAAKGRELARGGKYPATPVPAVIPDAATVFVGTLLWSSPLAVDGVLELVHDDDIESPALSVVLAMVRQLAAAGRPCDAQIVMDELHRTGTVSRDVAQALMDATASGADPAAARYYGAAVVSSALRRRIESAGHALTEAASAAAEPVLAVLVTRWARAVQDCADRLAALRGDV